MPYSPYKSDGTWGKDGNKAGVWVLKLHPRAPLSAHPEEGIRVRSLPALNLLFDTPRVCFQTAHYSVRGGGGCILPSESSRALYTCLEGTR